MTNEQMSILLDWIVGSLEGAILNLRETLCNIEGIERKPNLYKNGEYRGAAYLVMIGAHDEKELEALAAERGYEVRYDGEPVMLGGLYAILNKIRQHKRTLKT